MAAAALVRSRRTVPVEELPKSAGVWRRARAASHGHIMALSVRPRATGSSPSPRAALLMFTYFLTGTMGSEVLVPERVSAVLGKNVTLGCRVEVGANLSLTQSSWERHLPSGTVTLAVYNPQFGTSIPSEYKQRLSFRSPSPYDATIVLTDVGFSDIGTYTCKVATFPLGNTQASTYVTVLVEPKVYVSAGSTPLLDGGNETVVATCTAERARPPAEVSWETELFGHSQVRQQVEPNGTTTTQVQYTWHPTRHAQGHNITCVVRHPALHTDFRIPYQLNVQFSPDITVVGYSSDWYVGQENAQLQCRANANPPAHLYTWTRLDSDLPGDVYIFNNTLVFSRPVRRNDSGVYRCEVENRIGSRSRDTRIRVQEPPPTTMLPTTPLPALTANGLTTTSINKRRAQFTSPTVASLSEGSLGTIVGGAVGGALFLLLLLVLGGACYRKQRRTFRGDYYTKQYLGPADMQKEPQLDMIQPHELQDVCGGDKGKGSQDSKATIVYSDKDREEWGDRANNGRSRVLREAGFYCNPQNNSHLGANLRGPPSLHAHNSVNSSTPYSQEDTYDNGPDGDYVSHMDGSVISRREWYV
ncbi:nectin-3-like protein-like [Scleropages formosus]|nr:nectin-3-like protein isoform X1 [Scleropages formosus]KPP70653.1 nectin-3-like protein-like [Scleropages formosus]